MGYGVTTPHMAIKSARRYHVPACVLFVFQTLSLPRNQLKYGSIKGLRLYRKGRKNKFHSIFAIILRLY